VVPDEDRHGFNIREFARIWGLDASNGGGAHMWREVWDDDVSVIYKDMLSKRFFPVSGGGLLTSSFQ
jgi:large subunit ribosomal protein L35